MIFDLKKHKYFSFRFLYWTYILFLGLVFVFLIPPFQKPDEHTHYNRALSISDGQLFCQLGKNLNINAGEYDLTNDMQFFEIVHNYEKKFPKSLIQFKYNNRNDRIELGSGACLQNFIGYIPNVIGIFIGRLFKLPILSFYFARFFGLLFYVFCLYISLSFLKDNNYKKLIFLYSIIPKVIFQVTAISYDVVQLSLTPVIFSLFIKLLTGTKNEKLYRLFFGGLIIVNFVFVKAGYYLLSLIYILAFKKYSKKELVNVIFFIFIVVCSFYIYSITSQVWSYSVDDLQSDFLKSHPEFFIGVLYQTTLINLTRYINEIIGVFGYNDFNISPIISGMYIIYVYVVCSSLGEKHTSDQINFRKNKLIILGGLLLGTYIAINFAMYCVWTPVGKRVIDGVQGRYFIPLFPYILLIFIYIVRFLRENKQIYIFACCLCVFIFFITVISKIYDRFFNYSELIINENEARTELNQLKDKLNWILLDKRSTFIVDYMKDRKASGFLWYVKDFDKHGISYIFKMMDSGCRNELYSMYISSNLKDTQEIIKVSFDRKVQVKEEKVCISIEPLLKNNQHQEISIYNNSPMIRFLYIYY